MAKQRDETPETVVTQVIEHRFDPPAPAPAPTVDIAAIVQAAVTAALAAGRTNADDLAGAITAGMQSVREPIPEQKEHHGISAQNPLGELKHPRPELKCEMWYGVIDDDGDVTRVRPIDNDELTIWELLALNMLEPADTVIKRLDGERMRVVVEGRPNRVTGVMDRLTLAYPITVIGKKSSESKNTIPDLTSIVYQLTKHDLREDTLSFPEKADDLAWLLAEHRAKRYVSTRDKVAA